MRRWLGVLALGLAIFAAFDVVAQCGSTHNFNGGGGVYGVGSLLQIHFFSGTPSGIQAQVEAGIDMWYSACTESLGFNFPFIQTGGGSGGAPVWIYYHSGNSDAGCGFTQHYINSNADNHFLEATIEIWEKDVFGVPCDIAELAAHEIGHVLGLDDTTQQNCGSIMDDPSNQYSQSVSADDCAAAASQWRTDWELYNDEIDCNDYCGSSSSGCTVACHVVMQPGNCGGGPAPYSPIVVDLDGDGYEFAGVGAGVRFDHDGDGIRELTGWTARGQRDAFLFLDLNGNGVVDSGRELFGNYTLLPSGGASANGFIALASYDELAFGGNGDGVISPADSIWYSLRLWIDTDQDARTGSSESIALTAAGVQLLGTTYVTVGQRDAHGNLLRYKGKAQLQVRRNVRHVNIFDVLFVGLE